MGFWSKLLKYGALGAATIATGGAATPLLIGAATSDIKSAMAPKATGSVFGDAGQVAGSAAGAMATGRNAENSTLVGQQSVEERARQAENDALIKLMAEREQAINQRAQTDLAQRKFATNAPNVKAGNVMRGDLMQYMKDATINRPGNVPSVSFSGGLRPSALGEMPIAPTAQNPEGTPGSNSRQAGAEMSRQALESLMKGEQFTTPPMQEPTLPGEYKPAPLAQAGALEKGMGIAGVGLSLADILAKYLGGGYGGGE